jgi:TP901 family phage tail tape measure protein
MGTAAHLSVKITANVSDFQKELGSLEKGLGSWGGKASAVGAKLTQAFTLPLAGAAVAATKFASDFEKSTTKLVTLSGISEKQMRQMKQAVLDLAPSVGIGPRALSEALLVVTSTGFEGAQAMGMLELAAKASAVGMGDTKDIARALTAAVSAYGAENLSASKAADILHATVVAGGAEATELAGELGRVVGVASQLGVSFQEVGAFIATYTRLGLSAAEATTGLSGVLNTMLDPSKEARDALAGLGLSADSLRTSIAQAGLGATLTDLIGRLHGNADATGALFGNVRALAGVMGTAGTQAAGYKANLEAITASSGGLDAAFQRTKQTFAFMWDQFKADAERAAITLGTRLLPAATQILQAAKPLADAVVNMAVGFSKLPQPVQTTVLGFLGLAAAFGPIVYGAGQMAQALGSVLSVGRLMSGVFGTGGLLGVGLRVVTTGFGALGGVLAGISWPVVAIAGVVAAVTAAGVAVLKFTGLWDPLTSILGDVWTITKNLTLLGFETLKGAIADVSHIVSAVFVDAWDGAKNVLASFLGVSTNQIVPALKLLGQAVLESVPGLREMKDVILWLKSNVPGWASGLHSAAEASGRLVQSARNGGAPPPPPGFGASAFPAHPNLEMGTIVAGGMTRLPALSSHASLGGASKKDLAAQQAWQKELDRLSGREAVKAASDLGKKIAEVGGFAKVSTNDLADYNDKLVAAIDAYKRLGLAVPLNQLRDFTALQKAYGVTTSSTLSPDTLAQASKLAELKALTEKQSPQMLMAGLIPALSAETLAGAPKIVGPFREAFSDLGHQLPDLIFGTLQRGGSVVAALASGLAAEFSKVFQKGIQTVNGKQFFEGTNGQLAMGMAGIGIGSAFAGYSMGTQFGKGKGAMAGAASGAMAGLPLAGFTGGASVAIGAIAGGIAGFFGGRSKEKKEQKALAEEREKWIEQYGGMEKLKGLASELGVNIDAAFTTKKPQEFQAAVEALNGALEKQKAKFEGIAMVLDGMNARAKVFGETLKTSAEAQTKALGDEMKRLGIDPNSDQGKALATKSQEQFRATNQGEFDRVGTMAFATFGLQMQTTGSAVAALSAMAPTLTVLTEAQSQFNFAASETVGRLLEINAAVAANHPAFEALAADGQIVKGMLQGNLMDMELFKAVSSDIGTQIQSVIEKGMPLSQALALSQPQLQSLWEAQQKFGFATDESTQALLDQATAQGIVGPQMKDVNQKILDVLLAIGKVLGADIPQALAGLAPATEAAAKGMNDAFAKVAPPNYVFDGEFREPDFHHMEVPQAAAGGIIRARRGGTLVNVGEGGRDEAIVPLGGSGMEGGRGGTVIIEIDGDRLAEIVVPSIPHVVRRYGL